MPDLLYVSLTEAPLSLAAAFEPPVRKNPETGYGAPSRDVLDAYTEKITAFLGEQPLWHQYATTDPAEYSNLGKRAPTMQSLLLELGDEIRRQA